MAKRAKPNLAVGERGRPTVASVLEDAIHDPTVRAVAASAAVAAGGALAAGRIVRDRALERAEVRNARRYGLLCGERMADGVRRMARGQLDLAIESLGQSGADDPPQAIHAARKALKRLRALLRVAREALGEETYRRENEILRDVGRELEAVRDAQVMVGALAGITAAFADELPTGAFAGLRDALSEEVLSPHEGLRSDPALAAILDTLGDARDRVAMWPLHDNDGLDALAPGFERIYRRGRRALRAVRDDPSTEHLHALRKRAKDLWHGTQIMRLAEPKTLHTLGRRAHRLADIVGEDHDLAVLLDRAHERSATLEPGELELLTALVQRRRRGLQRRALKRARRAYGRKPRKLGRGVSTRPAAPS